ncbi:50S ribosomal protein L18 [Blattabacterium cuenoti]|uniref:50S ribosomal protein L18 n=1 Tax=Blattabacterium cuenoti TaxID=1653831 RepID=UPI00163BC6AE|nr:50S ribosomal protein L18 [Blattabacterium cuenoti]
MKKKYKNSIINNTSRFRLSVFRSNKKIYAQIIDDSCGKTLVSCLSKTSIISKKDNKVKQSYEVGKLLGLKSKKLNIKKLFFDKKNYLYHGRIKALADGLRNAGLEF